MLTRERFERLTIEAFDGPVGGLRERQERREVATVALDRVRREPALHSQMVQVRRDSTARDIAGVVDVGCAAGVSGCNAPVLHCGSMIVCAVRSEASDR